MDLTAACAAGEKSLQSAHFDVDGDKVADAVCWRVRKSAVYGDFVEVAAHIVGKGSKALDGYIALSAAPAGSTDGSHGEPALFGLDAISAAPDVLDKAAIGELDTEGHFGRCIKITTGTGDKVWLFWVPDGKTERDRFYLQTPYN